MATGSAWYTVASNGSGFHLVDGSGKSGEGILPEAARTGYDFIGWNSAFDEETGTATGFYLDKSPLSLQRQNTTFYAVYEAKTYTVTFDLNGYYNPKCSTTSAEVTYDSTYAGLPVPTDEGHTFAGWYTSADGGTRIKNGDTVAITGNTTLYAHWNHGAKSYTNIDADNCRYTCVCGYYTDKEHTWKLTSSTEATCKKASTEEYECTKCGATKTTHDTAGNHQWELTKTVAATCKDGSNTYKCSVCNKTRTEIIPGTGNHYTGGYSVSYTCNWGYVSLTSTCTKCYSTVDVGSYSVEKKSHTEYQKSDSGAYYCSNCGLNTIHYTIRCSNSITVDEYHTATCNYIGNSGNKTCSYCGYTP